MGIRFIYYTSGKVLVHNKLVRVHSFVSAKAPLIAWLSNGNSSSSPATTSSMTKFSNVSCDRVVWRWLTRHDLPSRRSWVQKNLFRARRPGPCQRRRYGKALQMLWQGPGRRTLKIFFLDPSTTRRQHLSAVLIREAILGRVTVKGVKWHPGGIELRWHMYGRSLWRGTYLWNQWPFSRDFQ